MQKKKKNIAVKGTKMPRENCIYRKIIMWGMIGWRIYSPITVPLVLDIIHSMKKLIHVIFKQWKREQKFCCCNMFSFSLSRLSTNLVSLSNLFLKYLHKQGLERSKSTIFSILWKLAYKSLVKILPFC